MRYIEMHRGPAAYVLGPPPSRGGDLELEGGVNACHARFGILLLLSSSNYSSSSFFNIPSAIVSHLATLVYM